MLNKIVKGIIKGLFKIINKMFEAIFAPVFSGIQALFPDLAQYFLHITNFLTIAFTYVSSGLKFLLIPQECMLLLFSYFSIKYSIYLIMQSTHFLYKVYTTLKP